MVQPQRGLPKGKDQWRGAWNRQDEGGGIEGTCEKALGNTAEQAADWRIPASGSPSGGNTQAKGGVRTLGIPTVVDRLIQQGVHQVLSPIFEKDFSNQSYGFGLAVARKRRYERRRNASKRERAGWWKSI
jgi:hypothetical protein